MPNEKNLEPRRLAHITTVNRNHATPLYHQLYLILRDCILDGTFQPGDLLPPEPELMDMYQVSRITVRQAVDKLANENLVFKRRGKGTFVSLSTMRSDAAQIISFSKDMELRGYKPSTKLLTASIEKVSRVTAEKLGIKDGDELAYLKRLRFANDEPISIEENFLVHAHCPGILQGHNYEKEALFDVLESQYNIRIERAEQTISAMVAAKNLRNDLGVSSAQALLYIERISFSQLDIPIEFQRIYYRGDRYALELALKRY